MNLTTVTQTRYATKAYDAKRRIPQTIVDELLTLLRNSPSSVNSQPWHFVVASTPQGRAQIAKGVHDNYAYNEPKVLDASHVIVFCTRMSLSEQDLENVLEQEERDGRFQIPNARANQRKTLLSYVNLHRHDRKDLQHWMEKQTYLALGTLLLGAATLGIDATPMEGFDPSQLDAELGLRDKGFTSVALVSLGYHSDADFNAKLPKSRLPKETVFSFL